VIVEVPRWTNAKMEISKEEPFNPILQGKVFSYVLTISNLKLIEFGLAP
jgi:inorganic pyrophosphatase